MKAKVDPDLCTACGLCPEICPDVFELGDDVATVKVPEVPAEAEESCREAAQECPAAVRYEHQPQLSVLGQFLFSALGSICREVDLAPALVGTPNDLRDLVAFRTGQLPGGRPPRLAQGWRAEVIGQVFDDLLAGKLAVRIGDPASECPLVFDRLEPG